MSLEGKTLEELEAEATGLYEQKKRFRDRSQLGRPDGSAKWKLADFDRRIAAVEAEIKTKT